MAFYAYRLHTRGNENIQTLHRSACLFQEFTVDAYAQIEQNRLRWFQLNQDSLRVDLYKGIADAVHQGIDLHDIRQRKILPASFTGSPRSMYSYYHDAIAIVRHYEKPDLFPTITCNPK
jgi:Helitron helicase-like domain at N-terminus